MDINDLRSISTVISMLTFIGIIWWAYSRNNAKRFEDAANLPFAEDNDSRASSGTTSLRR